MRARFWRGLVLTLLFLAPFHASADTLFEEDVVIEVNTTWNEEGSPYVILGDVTVASGARLTVEASVEILFDPGVGFIVLGSASFIGTSEDPIGISSGEGILVVGGDVELSHTFFLNSNSPLTLVAGDATLSSVDIDTVPNGEAILVFAGASLVGDNISIEGVDNEAVLAYGDGTVVDLSDVTIANTGGYGAVTAYTNASVTLEDVTISAGGSTANGIVVYGGASLAVASSSISGFSEAGVQTFQSGTQVSLVRSRIAENAYGILAFLNANVSIATSAIADNTLFGVQTFGTTTPVVATGVYWGSASGPQHATLNPSGVGNKVSSFTTFDPWLASDPLVGCVESCFSNVLFLPGLQASKLYRDGERIWPPPLFHDNEQLFLNASGTPATAGVYTEDVLDEVLGANVYKSFVVMMDDLVSTETIEEWGAYPYDWRLDINDIVANPTALESTVVLLVAELERLATSSRTDKVTIVGHSNGGLIGKLLISKLVADGKGNLVDKFVMVAVPQLGTPKAISSLLHGQGLPFEWLPILLTKSDARSIAENMPSAYTLLPSAQYFARVASPVVEFASSTLTASYRAQYGEAIDSREELEQFVLGEEGRATPAPSDTFTPNVLNEHLLDKAHATQDILDSWTAPSGIAVTQIVGWGAPTISGIRYVERRTGGGVICAISSCAYLDNEPILTVDGDKTVVTPSANAQATTTYYVDLKKQSRFINFEKDRGHHDILEIGLLQEFLSGIFKNETTENEYITQTKPTPSSNDKSLRMRVLSPVSIDLYDEFGHHTGIATTTPDGIPRIEENIPNSYYFEFGEGKYAGADSPNVKVYLNGQAEGTFTLDIDNIEGDTVVSSTSFVNVPVTPSSLASLAISEGQNISLQLDSGGDGVIEQSLSPGEYTAPAPLAETPRPSAGGKRSVQSVTKATEAKPSVGEVKTPVVYVVAIRPQQAPARVAQTLVKSVVEQNLQARAQQRSLAATAEALPKGLFKGVLSKLSKWLKGWSW